MKPKPSRKYIDHPCILNREKCQKLCGIAHHLGAQLGPHLLERVEFWSIAHLNFGHCGDDLGGSRGRPRHHYHSRALCYYERELSCRRELPFIIYLEMPSAFLLKVACDYGRWHGNVVVFWRNFATLRKVRLSQTLSGHVYAKKRHLMTRVRPCLEIFLVVWGMAGGGRSARSLLTSRQSSKHIFLLHMYLLRSYVGTYPAFDSKIDSLDSRRACSFFHAAARDSLKWASQNGTGTLW